MRRYEERLAAIQDDLSMAQDDGNRWNPRVSHSKGSTSQHHVQSGARSHGLKGKDPSLLKRYSQLRYEGYEEEDEEDEEDDTMGEWNEGW